MQVSAKIEALLFAHGEPMNVRDIARALEVDARTVRAEADTLDAALAGRGIRLFRAHDTLQLATAPEASEIIDRFVQEERSKSLGKAALETLAVVLYRGPITKSEIDYIRGVNTSAILRTLLVRGLIERIPNPKLKRSFLYQTTIDTLRHLGIRKVSDLPEYQTVRKEIEEREEQEEEQS